MAVSWELEKKILFCMSYEIRPWEWQFLTSIMYNIVEVSDKRSLSRKQELVLERIYKQACKEAEELNPILAYEYMESSVPVPIPIRRYKAKELPPRPESVSLIVDPPERPGRIYFHNKEEYETSRLIHGLPDLDEIPFDFPFFVIQRRTSHDRY